MIRAGAIQQELKQTNTIEDLTEVFESIASMHISKIHTRVVASKEFFAELWQTYIGLRVDPSERLQRRHTTKGHNVLLAVTAEGKLSGDSDERVIKALLEAMKTSGPADVMVVGSRGLGLLQAAGVKVTAALPLPVSDISINVGDLVGALNEYDQISVFYQTYDSLRVQRVARIELVTAVNQLSKDVKNDGEIVSSHEYIFEPGINEIADYMESVMMGVAVIQIIMESKLSQEAPA
jgi:F0F1-type ATP synthase gamma subunit